MKIEDFKDIHTHRLDAGTDAIINLPLGMDLPESGYYSVGVHPWDAAKVTHEQMREVELKARNPRVVAIGEVGLDKLQGPDMTTQEKVFRSQIALSEAVEKPLIIHAVRTLPEIIQLRKELKPRQRWIIHGFRGKPETAHQLLSHGIDISIGNKYNPSILQIVPPSHLFHETDDQHQTR